MLSTAACLVHLLHSVTGEQFKGQQRPSATEADRNNRTSVGFKEETGYVENNPRFTQTDDNKMRFLTHYMTRWGYSNIFYCFFIDMLALFIFIFL